MFLPKHYFLKLKPIRNRENQLTEYFLLKLNQHFWVLFQILLKKPLKFQIQLPILRMNTDHLPAGNVQKESPA